MLRELEASKAVLSGVTQKQTEAMIAEHREYWESASYTQRNWGKP